MKFGDITNPREAKKVVDAFRKKFKAKVCLSPIRDCSGPVIAAHTLSAESMLRPISRNGHVYALKEDLIARKSGRPISIELQGIRDTSVFYGFCSKHDNELFRGIEDEPFVCSPKQLFLYAFRALAKEAYLKRKQAEGLVSSEDIKKIHGIPEDTDIEFSDIALLHQAASLQGAEEIERTKAKFDEIYKSENWIRLKTTIIEFSDTPVLAASFVYAPDFDFEGKYLQDFQDFESDLSHLYVTILPHQAGGFALFSHLDTANQAPERLVQSLLKQSDLTSAVVLLILCHCENFAFSPDWYDGLSDSEKADILDVYFVNANPFDASINNLKNRKLSVDSWNVTQTFTI